MQGPIFSSEEAPRWLSSCSSTRTGPTNAPLYEEWQKYDTPLKGKGLTFFCTCPSGEHGSFTHVQAAGKEEALMLFPEMHRRTTTVLEGRDDVARRLAVTWTKRVCEASAPRLAG